MLLFGQIAEMPAALVICGRGGGIRTRDLLLPKQERYQAALLPGRMNESTARAVERSSEDPAAIRDL